MRGVHHQHGVKAEPHRARLDIPHARELQRRQHFAIGRAAFDTRRHFLQHALAGRVFDQAHQRLDVGMELHEPGRQLRLGSGDARQLRQESKVAERSGRQARPGAPADEGAAVHFSTGLPAFFQPSKPGARS